MDQLSPIRHSVGQNFPSLSFSHSIQTNAARRFELADASTITESSERENACCPSLCSSQSFLPRFIQSIFSWFLWIITFGRYNSSATPIDNSDQVTSLEAATQDNQMVSNIRGSDGGAMPPPSGAARTRGNTESTRLSDSVPTQQINEVSTSEPIFAKDAALLHLLNTLNTLSPEDMKDLLIFFKTPPDLTPSKPSQKLIGKLQSNPNFPISEDIEPPTLGKALYELLNSRDPKIIAGKTFNSLAKIGQQRSSINASLLQPIIADMDEADRELLKAVVYLLRLCTASLQQPGIALLAIVNNISSFLIQPPSNEVVNSTADIAKSQALKQREENIKTALRSIIFLSDELFGS